ncbi:uncharacterized protein ASPGLDRAFT_61009 [Aspergillus glaucus CBS 516.65]|uniref:Uncharacterized protein n=1 Tax=Aspergillus glaucus CBS 516.65 TaxID=1160497 RepID=A0A1L9V9V9_ASPGL|nr:hypothetical protein ASPGLDRAFT_61009 [Aspergillus glaucus CBS 516.65]OJJ80622.1 hypothetical protein ASPGLDRAFT_61009 [Aspergillus glaucus CBS 516.65]
MDILEDLQKKTAAALKSTEELEASSEEAQIERQLAIYDCGRNVQSVELLMEFGKRGDGDEDGVLEFINQMKFRADIIADAELFTSGMKDEKDTFLGLYYQDPRKFSSIRSTAFTSLTGSSNTMQISSSTNAKYPRSQGIARSLHTDAVSIELLLQVRPTSDVLLLSSNSSPPPSRFQLGIAKGFDKINLSERYTRWREDSDDLVRRMSEAEKIDHLRIDCKILAYDFAKLFQSISTLKEVQKHNDASKQKEVADELMGRAVYKADIITDAQIFASDRRGSYYATRLLEFHANLLLNKKEVTPEVEHEHHIFLRMLLYSYLCLAENVPFIEKEYAYPYYKVVRDTTGW